MVHKHRLSWHTMFALPWEINPSPPMSSLSDNNKPTGTALPPAACKEAFSHSLHPLLAHSLAPLHKQQTPFYVAGPIDLLGIPTSLNRSDTWPQSDIKTLLRLPEVSITIHLCKRVLSSH